MINFPVGARVRSYDFPSRMDCYVDGVVVGVADDFYRIEAERRVLEGEPQAVTPGWIVCPPLNGVPGLGGLTCGVVGLDDEALLRQALDALAHHRSQTRRIRRTDVVIAVLAERLGDKVA